VFVLRGIGKGVCKPAKEKEREALGVDYQCTDEDRRGWADYRIPAYSVQGAIGLRDTS
jgi:hypothetical protein